MSNTYFVDPTHNFQQHGFFGPSKTTEELRKSVDMYKNSYAEQVDQNAELRQSVDMYKNSYEKQVDQNAVLKREVISLNQKITEFNKELTRLREEITNSNERYDRELAFSDLKRTRIAYLEDYITRLEQMPEVPKFPHNCFEYFRGTRQSPHAR